MTISRRTVFMAGAGVLATGLIGASTVIGYRGRTMLIKIAGGEQGGVNLKFAELLAAAINTAGRGLSCIPEATEGSVANIRLIGKGYAHFGITMADTALAALGGEGPFESAPVPVSAIGRLHQNYLQLVVREDAPLYEVADLAGKKVSLGSLESGNAMFGMRLFDAIKLEVDKRYMPLGEATTALENKDIDAMVWLGGVPTPALTELNRRVGITLLPTEELVPVLRAYHGTIYRQATIPSGSYGRPGMPTVGVANFLVCADTLADDIAAAVTRVLIDQATQLVPSDALDTQFLDSRSLITTLDVPMHPGAASVYRDQHG